MKVNQKHGTTLMYHTRAGANSVGSVVWDLLYVMKDFDPKHVGFHWDTGHMSHHGSNTWELLMRTAGPYVVGMGWKDRTWEQNLGFLGEGGPYPGPTAAAAALEAGGGRAGGRGGGRGRGGAAAGGEAPDAGAGRGAVPPPVLSPAQVERAGRRMPPVVVRGGAPEGGEGGSSRGGSGTRRPWWSRPGRSDTVSAAPRRQHVRARRRMDFALRADGHGARRIFRYATVLRDIGFDGPMELEAEYQTAARRVPPTS